MMNKQLYSALLEAGVPEDKASAAAESVAEYQKDINDLRLDLTTKISVFDVKLNILIAIALTSRSQSYRSLVMSRFQGLSINFILICKYSTNG